MAAFTKTATTLEQQLANLRQRGLLINDEVQCRHFLSNISYFRLSAYIKPFYQPNQTPHVFRQGTDFADVLHLYVFDRELRLLLLDAIERIEVALRAVLTNTLAEHHGPHGYLNPAIFDTRYDHGWLLARLDAAVQGREKEAFLAHYRAQYRNAPPQPPIWMAMEVLTFKEVSILCAKLRLASDTQRLERHFGVKYQVLKSWFRSISDLRNLCAHHARIWNREFGSRPEIPRKAPARWPAIPARIPTGARQHTGQTLDPSQRLFLQVVVLEALMQVVCPKSGWVTRLRQLFAAYPQVSQVHMGFAPDWEHDAFWQ